MKKPIRVAVVDDHFLFRRGVISLLDEFKELKVVVDAGNGQELLGKLNIMKVDVILLDLEMPIMDGYETTKQLHLQYPQIKIVILTFMNEEAIIENLIELGAHGFILKGDPEMTVLDAIHSVVECGYFFNDMVSKEMVKNLVIAKTIIPNFRKVHFTKMEIVIIRMICNGLSNREIAEKLVLSIRTIEGHRERILNKTRAKNGAGIAMYAVKNNLLE